MPNHIQEIQRLPKQLEARGHMQPLFDHLLGSIVLLLLHQHFACCNSNSHSATKALHGSDDMRNSSIKAILKPYDTLSVPF